MADAIIIFLKALLILTLATCVLAWLTSMILVTAFIRYTYRATNSADPFEWLAYLRSLRSIAARPPEIVFMQLWMCRVALVGFASVLAAMVFGISLAVAASTHAR